MSLVHTMASSQGKGSLLVPIPWSYLRRRNATAVDQPGQASEAAAEMLAPETKA